MSYEMTPTERLAAKIQGLQAELELLNEALFFEKSETARLRGQLSRMITWAETYARASGGADTDGPLYTDIRNAQKALNKKD